MSLSVITALLWIAALGSGLIAGVYFAFSVLLIIVAFTHWGEADSGLTLITGAVY